MSKKLTIISLLSMALLLVACGSGRQTSGEGQVAPQAVAQPLAVTGNETPVASASASDDASGQVVVEQTKGVSTLASDQEEAPSPDLASTSGQVIAQQSLEGATDVIRSGRTVDHTSVYLAPTAQSTVLGDLALGELVVVTRALDDWYEIIYIDSGTHHAWVSQAAISFDSLGSVPDTSAASTSASAEAEQATQTDQSASDDIDVVEGTVLASKLNVRSGPDTSNPILGQLTQGDRVQISDRQDGWLQIATVDSPTGLAWISGTYVAIDGEPMPVLPEATEASVAAADFAQQGTLVFQTSSGGAIYTMNGDGSDLQLVATGGLDPALSPDGSQVVYTRWDEPRGLFVVNTDGSNERWLAGDNLIKNPTWSPDGEQIAFSVQLGGNESQTINHPIFGSITIAADPFWRLQVIDADGENREGLADNMHSWNPNWGDQGIIYAAEDGLYVTYPDGEARPFYLSSNLVRSPSWSPDGGYVVATMQFHDHWEIVRLNGDGSGLVRLTKNYDRINSVAPTWSPDGSSIAYLTDQNGEWELWVMNGDGSNQRPLAPEVLSDIEFQYDFMAEHVVDWR